MTFPSEPTVTMSRIVAPALYHDDAAQDVEGPCIARVRLACAGCGGRFEHCHVNLAAVREDVRRSWRCVACRQGTAVAS